MGKERKNPEGKNWCFMHKDFLPVENFNKDCNTFTGLSRRCKDCQKIINSKRKHNKYKKSRKTWESKNPNYMTDYNKKYREDNKPYFIAKIRERYAKKLNASPKWKDDKKILKIYELAKKLSEETGEKYHVDHIIPLTSPLVCGLHNEFNLQVIPARENLSKGNKF